ERLPDRLTGGPVEENERDDELRDEQQTGKQLVAEDGGLFHSGRHGESVMKPERQRRLRVRGLSTRSYSPRSPSPGSHLAMRSDLSPAGRGDPNVMATRVKPIMLQAVVRPTLFCGLFERPQGGV